MIMTIMSSHSAAASTLDPNFHF